MHDTTVKQTDVAGDSSVSPQPPTRVRGAEMASGFYVVRSTDDECLPPSVRRGTSRSWIAGAWSDPF
jgi:hypothetical protein